MARNDEMKSSKELEQEVNQQRSAVEQTLVELVERLSPQHLLRSLLGHDEKGGSQAQPGKVMDLLSANPAATLLAAAGLGWLLMSQSRQQEEGRARRAPPWDEPSHASYGVDPDYDPRSEAGHVALEKTQNDDEQQERPYRSESYGDNLGDQVSSMMRNQPLLAAVCGIALGGLLGAALPRLTRHEMSFSERLEEYDERTSQLPSEFGDMPGEGPTRH